MNKQKVNVTLKKATVTVTDSATKLRCIALVAKLESVQEDLDFLQDVSIAKREIKKSANDLQRAISHIISNWYKENIPFDKNLPNDKDKEQAQYHFGELGKQYETAIKAVTDMHMGMWMCVPDLLAEPKTLPADSRSFTR